MLKATVDSAQSVSISQGGMNVRRIPAISKECAKEAALWRQNVWKFVQKPGDAVAGEVGYALLFVAELTALFKVGEFLGRGCTLFGYWP